MAFSLEPESLLVRMECFNPLRPDDYRLFRFVIRSPNPHLGFTKEDDDPVRVPDDEETLPVIETNCYFILTNELVTAFGEKEPDLPVQELMLRVFQAFWKAGAPEDHDEIRYESEEEDAFIRGFLLQMFSRRQWRGRIVDANGWYPN